ncbi:MAG: tRNA (N(6)-L-threonylcarbamoyladenosine(37)-C(2))-methylthiotransferase MtaB [Bacteroidota bacterium]
MPTVEIHTLGCKLNQAESAAVIRQFAARGFAAVPPGAGADVCVINTCTVTHRADRDCRRLIRGAVRRNPASVILVTGCYAQTEPEQAASLPGVDVVLGTAEKFRIFDEPDLLAKQAVPRVRVSPAASEKGFGPAFTDGSEGRTRAILKIQDGCDYGCSFCTVGPARGPSRSQSLEETVAQAGVLAGTGFREIVLTGVNPGEYGRDRGTDLCALLGGLEQIPGLCRIRLSSLEPNLLTPGLLERMAGSRVVCPHLHLPLQSGSDGVLRRMRRRYTSSRYRSIVESVRAVLPDAGIGADIIAGFPGETEEEFRETCRFLAHLPLTYLHVFSYSERPRTPAALMGDQVSSRCRSERSGILREIGARMRREFHHSLVGREVEILAEGETFQGVRSGLTGSYARVEIPASSAGENELVRVRILHERGGTLVGEVRAREREAA